MTFRDDFQLFVADAEARDANGVTDPTSQYARWAHDNPRDVERWQGFRDALLAGQRPSVPAMTTKHGRELVDAGVLYLDTTAAPAPPPPPPSPPPGEYETATAYLDEPAPTDGTILASVSAAVAAITAAKAGDVLIVDAGVMIPAQFRGFNHDAGGAKVVFRPGAGFSGHGNDHDAAVFLKGNAGWKVWGGTITNPNGRGILQYATPGPFKWTGFTIGDCGYTGLALYQTDADIVGVIFKGRAGSRVARLEWDPHPEKGTGIHAANVADVDLGVYHVRDSTIALDVAHQGTGAAIEVQQDKCVNVTMFARATNLGLPVPPSGGYSWDGYAKSQVAGDVIQIWDHSGKGTLDVKGVWADTIMGRIVETDGAHGDLSGVKVEHGRGVKTLQSVGRPGAAISGPPNYAKKNGLVLGDCQPTP